MIRKRKRHSMPKANKNLKAQLKFLYFYNNVNVVQSLLGHTVHLTCKKAKKKKQQTNKERYK